MKTENKINTAKAKKLIDSAYYSLQFLDRGWGRNPLEDMLKSELEQEKGHRNGFKPEGHVCKMSANYAAKYFAVEAIIRALDDWEIDASDVLDCRQAFLIGKALVQRYRSEIVEAFEKHGISLQDWQKIDYSKHIA